MLRLRDNYLDDSLAKWAIKYTTKLINEQKEYQISLNEAKTDQIKISNFPQSLKLNLENNSIKLSLLNHLHSLSKSQLPVPLAKPSNENPFHLYHTRTKIASKVTLLKTESDKNLDIVKNREIKMDKCKVLSTIADRICYSEGRAGETNQK